MFLTRSTVSRFPGTQLKEDYSMTMSSTPRLLMFLWSQIVYQESGRNQIFHLYGNERVKVLLSSSSCNESLFELVYFDYLSVNRIENFVSKT